MSAATKAKHLLPSFLTFAHPNCLFFAHGAIQSLHSALAWAVHWLHSITGTPTYSPYITFCIIEIVRSFVLITCILCILNCLVIPSILDLWIILSFYCVVFDCWFRWGLWCILTSMKVSILILFRRQWGTICRLNGWNGGLVACGGEVLLNLGCLLAWIAGNIGQE